MILCSNPHEQYNEYKEAIDSAIARVLQSGIYILGHETESFEQEFASFTQTSYCSGVANGTDALLLALKACDIGGDDEVITVSLTASATAAAIHQSGAEIIYVDVDPESYTMDITQLRAKIGSRTKAIVPVHLYGHPADMGAIMDIAKEHGLYVIEDCAQAHGATYLGRQVGSFGDLGCFSFYPTKNLGAIGDGGAVVSSNKALADKVKLLREYGWKEKFNSSIHGWNSRLDELQAAILRVKLEKLTYLNQCRADLADTYNRELASLDITLPSVKKKCSHAYHLYVIRTRQRDGLKEYLAGAGIQAGIHYPIPTHKQNAYQSSDNDLQNTDAYCKEILSLPMYPELGGKIDQVCSAVLSYYESE